MLYAQLLKQNKKLEFEVGHTINLRVICNSHQMFVFSSHYFQLYYASLVKILDLD